TSDGRRGTVAEDFANALFGHLIDQQRKEFWPVGDDADVGGVALITGAAVGHPVQRDLADVLVHCHSRMENLAGTSSRGTRHDTELRRGVIAVRTPPPPAGPH